jgi:glycosyltransferase involved in cell wall biosynthesis
MKSLHIAIFTNNYLPNPYGVTASVEAFRRSFEAMGHRVSIFAPDWKIQTKDPDYVYRYPSFIIPLKFRFPIGVPYSVRMDKIIADLDIDVIHSQHPSLLGKAARKWARKKNIPLIFTWHTLYEQYLHYKPWWIPMFVARWWVVDGAVNYANHADHVVVPTQSIKKVIKEDGVHNSKISVIPTGIEPQTFARANGGAVREHFGIAEDDIVILTVTRLTQEKNIRFLLDTVFPILKTYTNVRYVMAGGGDLLDECKRRVWEAGLMQRVFFTEEIPHSDVKHLHDAADIFAYASTSETQGMVIAEAMYAGLCVVAVRAQGVADQLTDATGILTNENTTEFGSALEEVIDNVHRRHTLGEQAQRYAQTYLTQERSAKNMIAIYEQEIERKGSL